jgi:diguanylate cyclase (GGDEF)-like protein
MSHTVPDDRGSHALPVRVARRAGALLGRRRDGSQLAFTARMLASVAITFALVGVVGGLAVEHTLASKLIDHYAAEQRADARTFEAYGETASTRAQAIAEIDQVIDAVAQRPGVYETLLMNPQGVVRAAGDDQVLGEHNVDEPVLAALRHGTSWAGHEQDPKLDGRDFEFIAPVKLLGRRWAYEVTFDHRAFDAQIADVHETLAIVGLIGFFGGFVVFYLVGGRRLMRDHRLSLQRATRDGLTDLPNQRAFQDELPAAVASADRYEDSLALAVLDVDDFKRLNDQHGHPYGDSVLKRVAQVLSEARPGDRAYRIGGDEFALLLAHTDAGGGRVLAQRLSHRFAKAGLEVSIGVSALRRGQRSETLRAEADAALYESKRQGGGAIQFEDIRERVVVTTSEKKEAVRRLIEERRLTTLFQPIWDLERETLVGVEALTRPDPDYGLSGPAEAFDIAEQLGRVRELDVICVERALASAPTLEPGVLLFLNLSPLTLDLDADAEAWLAPLVERAGLTPQSVVIEVTERFGGRTRAVIKRLRQLREQGFKTALDDVGTGNSGLEMLRKIDAEFVKLDRSIVVAAATEPGARAVLMAMATFAHQTGAFVIAEGIEDEYTLDYLRALDEGDLLADAIVQGGQGYGLGRPAPELPPETPQIIHHRSPAVAGER